MTNIKELWNREGGFKHILVLAFPLILSTGAWSLLHFVDRMFLSWYSPEALAASLPAGVLNFSFVALLFGTTGYVNTFIAQYLGAGQSSKIGPVLWQGIYMALVGGVLIALLYPFSDLIFQSIGHDESISIMEADYFSILCLGSIFPIMTNTVSGFYVGLGKNWPVMIINFITVAINIALDALLIFGFGPIPAMGITGAALATVIAGAVSLLIYMVMILQPKYDEEFKIRQSLKLDFGLIKQILTFGLPNGIHMFLQIASFSVFLLILGTIGTTELAATNIAFNINTLAFLPMIGTGIAISMLVGQYIGKNRADLAERATYSGFQLTIIYMGTIALSYVLIPEFYLFLFAAKADPAEFAPILEIAVILLRFIAVYSIFDAFSVIFSHAIKGAGDTTFVMIMNSIMSIVILVIPTYVAVIKFKSNIYWPWAICTIFISVLGLSFFGRFLSGQWKKMKVIQENPHSIGANPAEVPVDYE